MTSKGKFLQVLGSILCLAIEWKLTGSLESTEFAGGIVTGPLLHITYAGLLLFTASLLSVLWLGRFSAIAGLLASLLSLPLALLFLAPGPFRHVVGGIWSVPLQSSFVLNEWTVGWFVVLLLTATICVKNLRRQKSVSLVEVQK
jgi:hypothetical protein